MEVASASYKFFTVCIGLMLLNASPLYATRTVETPKGTLIFPDDYQDNENHLVKLASGLQYIKFSPKDPACLNPATNPCFVETPASLACVYHLTPVIGGCNPQNPALQPPSGGWGTIALAAAKFDANAFNDLTQFSMMFTPNNVLIACTKVGDLGKSTPCFCQIDADVSPLNADTPCNQGTSSSPSCTVEPFGQTTCTETSIDTQWSHAMAPKASILLVQSCSQLSPDTYCTGLPTPNLTVLKDAVATASRVVSMQGGGEVSQSYSFPEFPQETSDGNDAIRQSYNNIVYFNSSGDEGAPARYPASSPYVIAAGASSIVRDSNGNFVTEVAWGTFPADPTQKSHSSGGISLYELRPSYQNIIQRLVGTHRGTPDISFNGDPTSGMFIYDSNINISGTADCPTNNWCITGGTSLASPALAGVINVATGGPTSTVAELNKIYSNFAKHYTQYWREITTGYNGTYAGKGYNFVTGIGTPLTYQGK